MAKRRIKEKPSMTKLLDVKEHLPIIMCIVALGVVIWLLN